MVNKLLKTNDFTARLIVLAVICVLILITSFKLVQLKGVVENKETQLSLLNRDYKLLDEMLTDKKEEQEKIDSVMATLPQTYIEVGKLAYKIEAIAKSHSLETSLLFDKEPKEDKGSLSFVVIIETTGNYQDFANFLSDLTALPYNVLIDKITYENVKDKLTQTTHLKVYIRK